MSYFTRNPVIYFGLIAISASTGLHGQTADLFFSEYVEGSEANQVIEIYNGTGVTVNLAPYIVELYPAGMSTPSATYALSTALASLEDGKTLLISNPEAERPIPFLADAVADVALFDGDDTLALRKDGVLIDVIGVIGEDPGDFWGSGDLTTKDHTLRRMEGITSGDPDGFLGNEDDLTAEWTGFGQDEFDGLGVHPGINPGGDIFKEIFQIQGSGATSLFANQTVTTENNVVTTVLSNAFFMQTPSEREDGNLATSNGIYVFTSGSPGVAVGDRVNVTGEVVEFFGLTEFTSGSTVTVLSSGNPLPQPIQLDADNPSPDPKSFVTLERAEGMLVAVASGISTGPTNRFGNLPVVAKAERTFREPGILFPGQGGLPVWDGNPEIFELNSDGLGLTGVDLPAGTEFDASGVLFFSFGEYQLLPDVFNFTTPTLPRAVRDRNPGEFTVGTQNFRLFSDSEGNFEVRNEKFSRQIREILKSPDILGVQEVRTLSTLTGLAAKILQDDAGISYTAYMISTTGTINNGFLVRDTITVDSVTELGADETLPNSNSTLHDRPPVLLSGSYTGGEGDPFPIKVIVVHNRSLIDGDQNFVRIKRFEQAQSIARMTQDQQTADPDVRLLVLGDFNAYEFTDGLADAVGQIAGDFTPEDSLRSGPDLVEPNLINQILRLPAEERYSFNQEGNSQALDHILASRGLDPYVTDIAYGRSNSDVTTVFDNDSSTSLRSSDHDGLVAFIDPGIEPDVFGGVDINGFSSWKASAWYLNYNIDNWPWIYHDEHGWQFVFDGSTPDVIYLWDLGLRQWIFLNRFTYRWEYIFSQSPFLPPGWFFTFADNTPDNRKFGRAEDGQVFSVPPDA